MKTIIVLACLLASAVAQIVDLYPNCGLGTNDKIVGGQMSSKGDWGWHAALRFKNRVMCGGSLIHPNWVVTAAHCVARDPTASYYTVDIGLQDQDNPDSWTVNRRVQRVIMHDRYDDYKTKNDIAMLKLSSPVTLDTYTYKVTHVCIPDGSENYVGRTAWATGFGYLVGGGKMSRYRMEVAMPIKTDRDCLYAHGDIDATTQVCAGQRGSKKDTCNGDSGGPLVVKGRDGRWHLVGLVSFGPVDCGDGGVYTRLSGFKSWISYIVKYY